ncbi:DUF2000 domain-containing protein [Parachitinimonas caeni]|uniref:DUF2000 domain-containing protein n=1 Tax=Parachitinimonas caeni TaxID=3031301 RepID=A0ABT7DVA6_9NEIS|nr:DUF2000 domain-containing protein [Parachitinimonas caeni]MDK2123070.1 DUF2000 domain-containing protein [Parachitinimonas caeni]
MENKCVVIVDESMPLGTIANTTAVLAATLGKLRPEMIGADLPDSSGFLHQGITTMALPILKGNGPLLKRMRSQLKAFEPALLVVDLISATRTTKSYQEYAAVLAADEDIEYFGLALFGDKKTVNSLTGSLGLLR